MLENAATFVLTAALARLAWVDLRTLRLPDVYTVPLIAAGLGLSLVSTTVSPLESALGGIVGFALFWAIGAFVFHRRGHEGLGLGDAKLFAACGTWLGYAQLPFVLLIASLSALAFTLAQRGDKRRGIAFGPWLAFGFICVWLEVQYGITDVIATSAARLVQTPA